MDLKIISADSIDLFLRPCIRSRPDGHEPEPDAAMLRIIIQLSIPTNCTPPAKLLSLSASLVGYESIGFPRGGFEQNQPYSSKKMIDAAQDTKLQAGSIYQFETSFKVDHNTAPYQRCKYGRHHQKVTAKATFPGMISKKTLVAEKNAFFTQTVSQSGSYPYYYVHKGAAEGLGPVFFGVRTQHLTVGGYFRITFSLASPSPTLRLRSLTLGLVQQTTLKSRVRRNYAEQPPAERFVFFEADDQQLKGCVLPQDGEEDGLTALAANQGISREEFGQASWVTRIPKDSEARASSLHGGDVAIHMAHALELIITYSDPSLEGGAEDVKTYKTSWGIILPACACRWQSMRLPSYAAVDPTPVPAIPRDFFVGRNEHESYTQCVCGDTLEDLLAIEEVAKKEREPEPFSEIWRQMLDMRLEHRLLRDRNARSQSASPAVSKVVSRRSSSEDVAFPTRERGRAPADPLLRGMIDDQDELEFEMQAREVLEEFQGERWQQEWDHLNEQRNRRAKARNEYVSLREQMPNAQRSSSSSSSRAFKFFQTPRSTFRPGSSRGS